MESLEIKENDLAKSWRPESKSIPTNPGVYKWKDSSGRILYVGKAKNLRARLTSYFNSKNLSLRIKTMVQKSSSLEWTVVANEIEALTLEFRLIKEFDPPYNIIFRTDDKQYPYIAITSESSPRVYITHQKRGRNVKFYGPFPKAWALKSVYSALQQCFGFRSCSKGVLQRAERQKRPCLLGYIEKCSAPCVNLLNRDEYFQNLNELASFFKGNINPVLKRLKQEMLKASEELKFEKAANIRDSLASVEVIATKNSIEFNKTENFDAVGVFYDEFEAAVHFFRIRKGIVVGENSFVASHNNSLDELTEQIFNSLYLEEESLTEELPNEILCNLAISSEMLELLKGVRKTSVKVYAPSKGLKKTILENCKNSAEENLKISKTKRVSSLESRTSALEELQLSLNLRTPPLRVECFDVSHQQGEFQTASMVVFEEGMPKKSEYRLFNIKDDSSKKLIKDDTAAIYQTICRRMNRLKDEETQNVKEKRFAYFPDLLVIDGGKPQVNAAFRAIKDSGLENRINVCSLAKRLEEVFIPSSNEPIIFSRNNLGLYLLQNLRDESHRFSIINMRKRRNKKLFN